MSLPAVTRELVQSWLKGVREAGDFGWGECTALLETLKREEPGLFALMSYVDEHLDDDSHSFTHGMLLMLLLLRRADAAAELERQFARGVNHGEEMQRRFQELRDAPPGESAAGRMQCIRCGVWCDISPGGAQWHRTMGHCVEACKYVIIGGAEVEELC